MSHTPAVHQPVRSGLFKDVLFYIHIRKNNKAEASQTRRLLIVRNAVVGFEQYTHIQAHGATQATDFRAADVVFVFLPIPGRHVIQPSTGIDADVDKPLHPGITLGKVIQLLAKRAGNMPDSRSRSRKHVVQAQWVQECLDGRTRQKYRSGWEIRVGKPIAPPHPRTDSSPPVDLPSAPMYDITSLGGSIIPQVPSFAIPNEQRLSPMTPTTSGACDTSDGPAELEETEVWGPSSPSPSRPSGEPPSGPQNVEHSSGVFAKSPHAALAFHVLEGPKQRIAEMNIAELGGGVIVPLHKAFIVVVPEVGVRIPSTSLIRRLVEAPNQSSIVVPLDWVFDCLGQDQLLDVDTYRLRSAAALDELPPDSCDLSVPPNQISESLGNSVEITKPVSEMDTPHEQHTGHNHSSEIRSWSLDVESMTASQKHLLDMLNPPLIPLSIAGPEAPRSQAQVCDQQVLADTFRKQVTFSLAGEIDHNSPQVTQAIAATLDINMGVSARTATELTFGPGESGDHHGSPELGSDPELFFSNEERQMVFVS